MNDKNKSQPPQKPTPPPQKAPEWRPALDEAYGNSKTGGTKSTPRAEPTGGGGPRKQG